MDGKVFNRVEKKYLITNSEKKKLMSLIKKHMKPDKYHESLVYNIYFDNDSFDFINQSIDWTDFKEKVRARSYGGYDRVFLEIKTKIRGKENNIGYKRRVMIAHSDFKKLIKKKASVEELSKQAIETGNDIQIAKEVDYLINYFDLSPKILVIYNRTSYKGENDLRITFDEKLKYRDHNLELKNKKNDKIYFKDDRNIIMEIKAGGALPLWLVKKLSELKIYPQRFSKIGKIYQKIRKEQNV
ncbi:polyphosphate polymerase domain-containing protein [Candidatus Saccharibacteria bacterium]|nr:polyphosphate polymerase domain-containing protein [Candidatus Saccharibacteria bacterium]